MSDLRYMLDTNIVSDMVRNPGGKAAQRGESIGQPALCVSVVTACELRFGALKKASERLSRRVGDFLLEVPALPFDAAYDKEFAEIRWQLERKGTPIGPFDMLIAAHARSLDLTLVTNNVREFSRVDGLKLENWLEEAPNV